MSEPASTHLVLIPNYNTGGKAKRLIQGWMAFDAVSTEEKRAALAKLVEALMRFCHDSHGALSISLCVPILRNSAVSPSSVKLSLCE